ncbi:hypothetical protein [Oscillatoria acuminata]|uniref:Uncharacterized protein n=1 Tax=Oscillatoria acuminata PCC 6304 TaxID=56110 RepID=K9TMR0_9CYAN|nr:hypothetical protein [Oscillatoria acuminata]AFY83815.1 hypothetical protein Oscil6304_4289 [Oscillatoria acuminata PCC 6304]
MIDQQHDRLEIHEFSTGIRPEKTADGGWVSRGFTGQYMNATIQPIPHNVQRAIANKEFAVAEGSSREIPAVIGRVISATQEEPLEWAVIALVTRGRDEKGRSASLYRYFLAKGGESLPFMLGWMETYRQQQGCFPIFDPFDIKQIGQVTVIPITSPRTMSWTENAQSWLYNTPAPCIIPWGQSLDLDKIHQLAEEKAKENQQPIAWASDVEAIAQPARFQIIQAASQKAHQLLESSKKTAPSLPQPAVSTDEQAIKSAINGLMNSSRVKSENMQAIGTALGQELPDSYWQEIFNGRGANNALSQKIYTPQMVRLLTLRAVVIPQTLPEYLTWLENNRSKQEDPRKISEDFQGEMLQSLSPLQPLRDLYHKKLYQGLNHLLLHLRHHPELLDSTVWLIAVKGGIWNAISKQLFKDMESDLSKMLDFANGITDIDFNLTDSHWKNIRQDIKQYWKHYYVNPLPIYEPWAELFQQLNCQKLAVCFNWISQGIVPKKLFSKFSQKGYERSIYNGMWVRRRPNLWEVIGDVYQDFYPFFIILGLVMVLGFSVFMAFKIPGKSQGNSNQAAPTTGVPRLDNPANSGVPDQQGTMPKESETPDENSEEDFTENQSDDESKKSSIQGWETEALQKFNATRGQLQKLVKEPEINALIQGGENEKEIIIIKQLKIILGGENNDLNSEVISQNDSIQATEEQQLKWIRAIEKYQNETMEFEKNKYGYLDPDPNRAETYNSLKEALRERIKSDSSSTTPVIPSHRN